MLTAPPARASWGQTSPPCHAACAARAGSLRQRGCAPIPTTAPWQLLQALALAAPFHVFAQALGPGSVMEEPSFPLVVLSGAEQPQGSVRTFPSTVLGDCIFGIKSELYLHPWRMWSAQLLLVAPVLLGLAVCRFSLFSPPCLAVEQRRQEGKFRLGSVARSPDAVSEEAQVAALCM